jgi:hypothetical protein
LPPGTIERSALEAAAALDLLGKGANRSVGRGVFLMRPVRHLTPRYVFNRASNILWKRRHPTAPWLTPTAINLVEEWLQSDDVVFEWGSGRSTVWFGERVGRVISVEHNHDWFHSVGAWLDLDTRKTVERHLVKTRDDPTDKSREDYVGIIDRLDEASIDLILVDGLHRDACAIRGLPKLRPGGLLVLDNADWYFPTGSHTPASKWKKKLWSDTWRVFGDAVSGWRRIGTTNGVWDTVIWIKP